VADLVPYARNPRSHTTEQIAQIARSICEFGWTNPILIGPDNTIIAGHARLAAARRLKMIEVPVMVLEGLTPAQRKALVIADNRLALNAGWDEEMLRLELEELCQDDFDLDLLGFCAAEVDELLAGLEEPSGGLTNEDAVPKPPESAITIPGDLWVLGQHGLLCGDATNASDVERLMAGREADLGLIDLPYTLDSEGDTGKYLKLESGPMGAEEYAVFLRSAFTSYRAVVKPTASLYICHRSVWQLEFQQALEAAGFEIHCQIIWAKSTFVRGSGRYNFQHEPVFYAHVKGERDAWYGDQSQSTLWQENQPPANHPTMKPVELMERALRNSSRKGNLVVDLFAGSGSTLIACERTRRVAQLMEIDPRYCDVIVRSWQDFARKKALLETTGRSFDQVAEERFSRAA
jgi:DNA modification methylase